MKKAQTIRIHKITGLDGREEVIELNLEEAKRFIENCHKWGCSVFDTRTSEVIKDTGQNISEISVLLTAAGGG